MKYILFSLLSVSLLFAADYVDGELLDNSTATIVDVSNMIFVTDSDETPDLGYTYASPIERAVLREGEGPSEWPDYDWGYDILVSPGKVGSGQDFDLDVVTGDMYAIYDTDHDGVTTRDSIVVYRSQDDGATWTFWSYTWANIPLNNPKIRIARDASGTSWVCMMYIYNSQLYTRRMTTAGSGNSYEMAASSAQFADMDADIGTGAYVYATYVLDGTTSIRVVRNGLDGSGWVDDANIYANTGITNTHPAVAAGDGGCAAVAFTRSTATVPEIRIKRTSNNGASWSTSSQVEPAGGWDNLLDVDVAFGRGGSSNIGWLTITFEFGTEDRFGYFSSTDTGQNWAWRSLFNTGDDENHGSIRANKSSGSVTVSYNSDPGDDVMFSWASYSNPTSFSTPIQINDFPATGWWPSCAGWNGGGWSTVLYTTYYSASYALYVDWYNNYGIETSQAAVGSMQNSPNPFNATTNISFSLTQSSPVTISIYNVAGQLVTNLADNHSFNEGSHSVQWDGQNSSGARVSPGVYFCRLSADGISQTHRMMMVR